jgi:hypothetical protein
MTERDELIKQFMLALAQNSTLMSGADDDVEWIYSYAVKLADVYFTKL